MAVIAIPISLQSMITIGINMTDTVMVGKLGETSLSATALANQFVNIYQICCMGIAMGASVLTSRFWGMQDITSLKNHNPDAAALHRTCGFVYAANHINPSAAYEDVY